VEIRRYQHVGSTLLTRQSVVPHWARSVHLPTPQHISLRFLFSHVKYCSNGRLAHYNSIDNYLVLTFLRNIIRGGSAFVSKRHNKAMTLHGVPFWYFTKIHLNIIVVSVLMCCNNVLSPLPQLHT
jgi:hypothetical protein